VPGPLDLSADEKRSGCLKWGLVGCAALSVLLIAGLVVLGLKARGLLTWALDTMEGQVVAACTSEVTLEEKKAFREAFDGFSSNAKGTTPSPEKMRRLQQKVMTALSDGKVTPDELRELTAVVSGK
jgi:hypothetical protein